VRINRRVFIAGMLAAGAGSLAACAGGGNREPAQAALLNTDGSVNLAELMKPGSLGERVLGNPAAPNTIIEYASLTCPYCRQFHAKTFPRVKKELIDTGKVQFIMREYPIGRTAGTAAIVARCAPEKDFFTLYDKFLAQQKKWTSQDVRPDAIYAIAAQTGMTRKTFDACLTNKEIEDGLKTVKLRGREFGVSGTPTFFINGKKFRGPLTFDQIKAEIAQKVT
jgi:protein-disulfide isomerase